MTHLVRLKIQLGGGVFEHIENCIFFIGKKKSQSLGSEIMCHGTLSAKLRVKCEFSSFFFRMKILSDASRRTSRGNPAGNFLDFELRESFALPAGNMGMR